MVLLIQCSDRIGLVADMSTVLATRRINIISMREYVDTGDNRFFVRVQMAGEINAAALTSQLQQVLPADAAISMHSSTEKRIAVLVTKEYHCLADILIRNHFKTSGASVELVIGNHVQLEDICQRFDIPFFHVSHMDKSKEDFESAVEKILLSYQLDYIVLAKFMRILSPSFVEKFHNLIINIHHSFLPAFAGASPYRQAYQRGVKLIGATAHFVTNELDEGPIIAQQIIPVNHSFSTTDMVRAGKEIETAVLARAMQLVFEEKVLIYKNKTIVFE